MGTFSLLPDGLLLLSTGALAGCKDVGGRRSQMPTAMRTTDSSSSVCCLTLGCTL